MPVIFTKTNAQNTNPSDGTVENVIIVSAVKLSEVVNGETVETEIEGIEFTFPDPTPDATIQAKVEAKLISAGLLDVAPTAPTLAQLKGLKKYQSKIQVTSYIAKHYDAGQQASLQALWIEATNKLYLNRKAQIQSVLDWVKSVLAHFYAKLDEIDAAVDSTALAAVTVNLAQFDATDPLVSVKTMTELEN